MALELEGRVESILSEQSGTSSRGEWVRGGFVIKTEGEYPKTVAFEVLGRERLDKMKQYLKVGGLVKVSFDVSSREWQGKYFTSLTAFSVFSKESEIRSSQTQVNTQQQAPAPQPQQQTNGVAKGGANAEDLPF